MHRDLNGFLQSFRIQSSAQFQEIGLRERAGCIVAILSGEPDFLLRFSKRSAMCIQKSLLFHRTRRCLGLLRGRLTGGIRAANMSREEFES